MGRVVAFAVDVGADVDVDVDVEVVAGRVEG